MDLISAWHLRVLLPPPATSITASSIWNHHASSFPFGRHPSHLIPNPSSPSLCLVHAVKKKKSQSQSPQPLLDPSVVQEFSMDGEDEEEEQLSFDDFEDDENVMSNNNPGRVEALVDGDDDYFEDGYLEDDADLYVGDGGGGGGIALAGTLWDKEALRIAEEACLSFDGELKIYAFRTLSNSTIQVRIERLTNKSGSPSMEDIEAFSRSYRARLDEAELRKTIPENIALEVSSPGVERVVRIPDDLDRFKDRPLYVKYVSDIDGIDSASETDGVFRLISFDTQTKCCTWGLADVRINREKAGKGRPLGKKQKEWRLDTPFNSLRLVRLFSEI